MFMDPKLLKERLRQEASKNPEKYYPTRKLNELGFIRQRCTICRTFFWTTNLSRKDCGDPQCSGGFLFLQKSYTKKRMSYLEVWKNFSLMFKNFGYTPIKRYPVVSRWNSTTDFTLASI